MSACTVGVWSVRPGRALALLARHRRAMAAVFTDAEIAELLREPFDPVACAACWAVKEAAVRALGLPPRLRFRWNEVRVDDVDRARPRIRLRGEVAAYARAVGVRRMDAVVRRHDDRLVATVVCGGGAAPVRRCEHAPLLLSRRPDGAAWSGSATSLRGGIR